MLNVMVISSAALFITSALADEQIVSATEQITREAPHSDRICESFQTIVVVHCDGPARKATLIACDPKGEQQVYRCSPAGYPLPPIEPTPDATPPRPAPTPYIQRAPLLREPSHAPRMERVAHSFHRTRRAKPQWWEFLFKRH